MKNPLDLKVFFPNYFNVWVFRSGVIMIFLLFLYTANSNDWNNEFKAYDCPESDFYDGCVIQSFDEYNGMFVLEGSYVGEKPNEDFFLFPFRTGILIISVFLINHLLFMLKHKKLYPRRRELSKK